jgi:hypothetical protein
MSETQFPTEVVDLPSKGWFYPPDHPLSSGQVDLHFMTARHEDILTSTNLIVKGVVIDRLLSELIATKGVNLNDLLIGDKYAIMVAARILGYGKNYEATVQCPKCESTDDVTINLEEFGDKKVEFDPAMKGKNAFDFLLPVSNKTITFKLLTQKDENDIQKELDAMKKLKLEVSEEVTTRMRYAILAVDGDKEKKTVNEFVKNMPAKDARSFREFARKIMPDIDLTFDFTCSVCGYADRLEVPINHKFFWPDAEL